MARSPCHSCSTQPPAPHMLGLRIKSIRFTIKCTLAFMVYKTVRPHRGRSLGRPGCRATAGSPCHPCSTQPPAPRCLVITMLAYPNQYVIGHGSAACSADLQSYHMHSLLHRMSRKLTHCMDTESAGVHQLTNKMNTPLAQTSSDLSEGTGKSDDAHVCGRAEAAGLFYSFVEGLGEWDQP